MTGSTRHRDQIVCICGEADLELAWAYEAPPEGETRFAHISPDEYHREIYRCPRCGHFQSSHDMEDSHLYEEEYVDAKYGDRSGIQDAFDRIRNLDRDESDNKQRVQNLLAVAGPQIDPSDGTPHVLDVGSGIGVFPYEIAEHGWDCTALDPDPRAVEHIREVVGVEGIQGDFLEVSLPEKFDLVTLNKVVEHVREPVKMVAKARSAVREGGMVYIEVPDGSTAARAGTGRQEFFVDHHHIFSPASASILIREGGLSLERLERVQDPSQKFTLRVFASLRRSS